MPPTTTATTTTISTVTTAVSTTTTSTTTITTKTTTTKTTTTTTKTTTTSSKINLWVVTQLKLIEIYINFLINSTLEKQELCVFGSDPPSPFQKKSQFFSL